jgi:hypothetical protein
MAKEIVKISNITQFADSLAKSIRSRYGWSKQLRNSVRLGLAESTSSGNVSIPIFVGVGNDKSGNPLTGMAGAYEFGSGIHGSKHATYQIRPKNGKRLAFNWSKASPPYKRGKKLAGVLPDGRLSFFYVDHPGVEAYPTIKPAVDATLKKATDELKQDIMLNIRDVMNLTIREINSRNW